MLLSDFDYALPEELIAQVPTEPRDSSRLLVTPRDGGPIEEVAFRDLGRFLRPGDLLVANDARVLPARLIGTKAGTGGKVELLLCEPLAGPHAGREWRALGQASKGLKVGARLVFDGLEAEVLVSHGEGAYDVRLTADDLQAAIERAGRLPLPPYIKHVPDAKDRERYQTVYAARPVAAAAPTAGLHFTPELMASLRASGIEWTTLTLHVGPGTFLSPRVDDVSQHRMHRERFEIPESAVDAIARAQAEGRRVIAVGTTSVRALESSALADGRVKAGAQETALFVTPGFHFQVVNALVTNFHLPKSTLLMLVSAFAGRERVLEAYRLAVERRFRFFSYGDAMFIA